MQDLRTLETVGTLDSHRLRALPGFLGVHCGRLCPPWMGGTKERFHQNFPTPRGMGNPLALKGNDKRAKPRRGCQDAFSSSESKWRRES